MKIYICILISKKNIKFLNLLLKSLNQLKIPNNYQLEIIFIIETDLSSYENLIKKKLNRLNYKIFLNNKKGIPNSRNIFIKFLKKRNYEFAGFLDDDCVVDNSWLYNMIKFFNHYNCDVIGGPQKHEIKNFKFKDFFHELEPKRYHGELVNWVATNNCFFSKKVLKNTNLFFDHDLSNYGGSDQLFFSQLSKQKFVIKWNTTSFITEKFQSDRENNKWFIKRNLRFGYSGNIIDKKNYGNLGNILVFVKIFYLLFYATFSLLIPTRKNYIKSLFFFLRAVGRLIGIFNYKPRKYI